MAVEEQRSKNEENAIEKIKQYKKMCPRCFKNWTVESMGWGRGRGNTRIAHCTTRKKSEWKEKELSL